MVFVDEDDQRFRADRNRRWIVAGVATAVLLGMAAIVTVLVSRNRDGRPRDSRDPSPRPLMSSPRGQALERRPAIAPSDARPTAPALSDLGICADNEDPLKAICQVGRDVSAAFFEAQCEKPEPGTMWRSAVGWSCRYWPPDSGPAVTHEVAISDDGPRIPHGTMFAPDDPRLPKLSGKILVATVAFRRLDPAALQAKAEELVARAIGWGCVEVDPDNPYIPQAHEVDCGAWRIRIGSIAGTLKFSAGAPLGFDATEMVQDSSKEAR